jgi:DNA-binding response OmpR family regulator
MKEEFDILIIDDEQVVIDSIKRICDINNYKVDFALDAETALLKINRNKFRIIISDIMMPGMDGFQFLNELRNKNIDTPVVITSGYSTIENAVRSLYSGALDFIPKPFTFDEILSVIKRCIKYSELTNPSAKNISSIVHVPCPAKYYRLGYSCWVNELNDGSVNIGATDIFIKTLENIRTVEFMENDTMINQAEPIVKLIAEDGTINQLYSAVSGRIIESNQKILSDITLLEKDPYFTGWLYRIIPDQLELEMSMLTPCSSDR